MRLDKLTIGSAKEGDAQKFKNLKNVTINFDEKEWVTVLIGWNGTGKSNVLEALAQIFRDLISQQRVPAFSYKLEYRCRDHRIHIDADPDRGKDKFIIYVASQSEAQQAESVQSELPHSESGDIPFGKKVPIGKFLDDENEYLPRFVFGYYSGESPRLQAVFRPYLKNFDKKLRNPNSEDPGFRRFFYALPIHSHFVLLAFVLQQDKAIQQFLEKHLGFDLQESIEYVLFVLREPPWNYNKKPNPTGAHGACKGNPDIFWGAEGVVRGFLDRLHRSSVAPVKVIRKDDATLWNRPDREYLHLFIKSQEVLGEVVGNQSPREFFRDLESTYVSELIEEVRIRVKLKNAGSAVTFRELSEGEQQMLTVIGLMRFTAEEESLFLLDEPDTHLNPKWSVDYLRHLEEIVALDKNGRERSHVLLTTHNPLAIAELMKQQVQILRRDEETKQVAAYKPELDPRGMGYAGIVTSDMFGLASTLDSHTQELLEEKRQLTLKDQPLSEEEREHLEAINLELEGYGFRYSMRDPLYEEYLRARYGADEIQPVEKRMVHLSSAERRMKAKELIQKAAKKVRESEEDGENAKN